MKFILLTAVCLILLSGCSERNNTPSNLPAQKNNAGTQAINITSNVASNLENESLRGSSTVDDDELSVSSPDSIGIEDKEDLEADSSIGSDIPAPVPESNQSSEAEILPSSNSAVVDVEIKEKMFIAQTNDIYLNAEDYLGKTIKYEGIFDVYTWEEENLTYYSVIRYGPGCCGTDGNAGFEIVWDGEYPNNNDWVEVIGTLEAYEEDGWQYLRLNLSSLTVLPTRGAEYVSQ